MSEGLDERIREALKVDMVVDITTTGRRTGRPHRIEIWAHYLDGQVLMTHSPGRRSWVANLLTNPEFTFHLKQDVKADLRATAEPVTDEAERRALLSGLKEASGFAQRRALNVDEWTKGSSMVKVSFPQ